MIHLFKNRFLISILMSEGIRKTEKSLVVSGAKNIGRTHVDFDCTTYKDERGWRCPA